MLNAPVAGPSEEPRHESMSGLDMTARWVPLTRGDEPIVVPGVNADPSHRPPTEMNQDVNPKYGFVETFDQIPFTGTNEKMRYERPTRDSARRNQKKERKRKRSPTRNLRMPAEIEPRVLGGPNIAFLERYGLDETSHPMDWFTAFMPLTPDANKEDPAIANVKGNRKTKFALSNWTAYSNTKAMMCNAGEKGHIFAGKFKPFKNKDIVQMLGVYILDGIAPSPQLVQKMQPQSKEPTHGNNKIASTIGPGYQ